MNAKTATSMMLSSGALSYFAFGEIRNFAKGGIDVLASGVSNSWNKSEDKFRQEGEAIGGAVGAGLMIGPNIGIAMHEQKLHGAWWDSANNGGLKNVTEAKRVGGVGGLIYEEMDGVKDGYVARGKIGALSAEGAAVTDATLLKTLKSGENGVLRTFNNGTSSFVAGSGGGIKGLWKGIAPFAYTMAAGWAITKALGFAGGLMDQAMQDEHRFRRIHYDNRFINTQQDQMTNMQQLGAAMNNYENRMQSTARIYHSR